MEYEADNPQKYRHAQESIEAHEMAPLATDNGNPEDEESAEETDHHKDNSRARDRPRVELLTTGINELRIHGILKEYFFAVFDDDNVDSVFGDVGEIAER
jgi:hypothetical protein